LRVVRGGVEPDAEPGAAPDARGMLAFQDVKHTERRVQASGVVRYHVGREVSEVVQVSVR